jgi:hypothetical protein
LQRADPTTHFGGRSGAEEKLAVKTLDEILEPLLAEEDAGRNLASCRGDSKIAGRLVAEKLKVRKAAVPVLIDTAAVNSWVDRRREFREFLPNRPVLDARADNIWQPGDFSPPAETSELARVLG